jgi:hypothetical protein
MNLRKRLNFGIAEDLIWIKKFTPVSSRKVSRV